jgi:hypothetical protein
MGFPPVRETTFGGANDRARQFEMHLDKRVYFKLSRPVISVQAGMTGTRLVRRFHLAPFILTG